MSVLLADIGGTHARFSILKSGKLSDIYRYRCSDFKSSYMAIRSFLLMQESMPNHAIIAMAGVVINGQGKWTNLDWTLSEKKLKQLFGFSTVLLVNDLIPQGKGVLYLKSSDVIALNKVRPEKKSLKALMSLGTGLGACVITPDSLCPSEYGQTILTNGKILEKDLFSKRLKSSDEKTVNNEKFYRYLASVIQNFVLSTQPLGGLYLVGGMLSAKDLKKYDLIKQLINHPTMQPLLKKVPVYLIVNKNLAFIGLSKLAKKSCLT